MGTLHPLGHSRTGRGNRCRLAATLLVFLAGCAAAQASVAGISATVEPQRFQAAGGARLTVSLSGTSTGRPVLPPVEGLRFVPAGQSSQVQIVNGVVSSTTHFSYVVLAEGPGRYRIPPIEARIDGDRHSTEGLTVEAVQGTRSSSPPPSISGRAPSSRQSQREGQVEQSLAFLRIEPSKTTSYVGELVPVRIKAYVREGLEASLTSLPALSSEAFALHGMAEEPQRTRERVGREIFTVLTWYQGMSASKEGEFQVGAQFDATLLVPERSGTRRRRSSSGGGSFSDDFFDDFFGGELIAGLFGGLRERHVVVESEEKKIKVLPLPLSGRPEGFTGAVGRFDVTVEATPVEMTAGDPVTLRIAVRGYGNFDRVLKPRLGSEVGWKVYTPDTHFEAHDSIGYEGLKTFEQAVIALDGSLEEIPALEFSYFDPERARFETVKTRAIPVQVTDAPMSAGSRSGSARLSALADRSTGEASDGDSGDGASETLHIELGSTEQDLFPMIFDPIFLGLQTVPLTALCLGIFLRRRRERLAGNPDLVRRKQADRATAAAMKYLDRAIRKVDLPGFFGASRRAAQERLGGLWRMEPRAITLADVRQRLPHAVGVAEIFERADAAAYSGERFTQNELRAFRDRLKKDLATLGC